MSTEIEGKVERLQLQKDDLLVITFKDRLSCEQVERVREWLLPMLARKGLGQGDVIVLDNDARLTVVNKAGDAA